MKKIILAAATLLSLASCGMRDAALKKEILADERMDQVYSMAQDILSTGLTAGTVYVEVWIRDFNTFIKPAMDVLPDEQISFALETFMKFQGEDGNIVDGYTPYDVVMARGEAYDYIPSAYAPDYLAHKNTVETDQESSFVQAVAKYVTKSGNYDFLKKEVAGMTVAEHMEKALDFLWTVKRDTTYGLVTGATTVDWGDVQPESEWGVVIDEDTHFAIDVYDNAMFILAINDYMSVVGEDSEWVARRDSIASNVRKYLWDEEKSKFIPHIYLGDSPFPEDFDESVIWYTGGTGIAALAGLMSDEEIAYSNKMFLANMKEAGATTICMAAYPPYPEGFFRDWMAPYKYQNGGDWTWYGVRILWAMIDRGMLREAYEEFSPMLDRVIKYGGFNEWYSLDGVPSGSGVFRGEAGVMIETIDRLREAARN
ncbi:MAG: hypothetical protein MJY56_00785 [Bacteroidales bacterium]|nr:hypothetical protein [Bacteroidales bacterium]